MQIKKLFCLVLAFSFVATTCFAQEEGKADGKKDKALANLVKTTMKAFAAAKLTDEQVEKATEIVHKHADAMMTARKALDATLTKDQKKARTAAVKKLKEEGVKGNEIWTKAVAAIGLSEEEAKKYDEAKKVVSTAQGKLRTAISALLTDEQKAAMPKRGGKKGKGKGKGKKKDDSPKTQTVALKLPGMTWGGCARSVRTALSGVDGIAEIKTNPSDNSCSFVAPAGLDVKATLNELADGGNKHIKGWSLEEE